MTLIGPDAGYVVEPESAPIFASENLLAHEIFAYAFLQYARETMTPKDAADASIGAGNAVGSAEESDGSQPRIPEVCVEPAGQ